MDPANMKIGQLVYFRGVNNETLEGRVFNVGNVLIRIAVYAPIDEPPGRELTYHIICRDDVMVDEEVEPNLLDTKDGPNPYISQADVHSLIYMIQAGDTLAAVERLRTWLVDKTAPDHIRYVPTHSMDAMKRLQDDRVDVKESHLQQLLTPDKVAMTPLDFGCAVDLMNLTDRYTPREALRVVIDAAKRFRRKNAAASGFMSGILTNKRWVLHNGDFTEQFFGQPPPEYVEYPSANALQKDLRKGRHPSEGPNDSPFSKTLSPRSKVHAARPRPTSKPTESGDSGTEETEEGSSDIGTEAQEKPWEKPSAFPVCKHWVNHSCFYEACKYSHMGPGGLHPKKTYKKRRRHSSLIA